MAEEQKALSCPFCGGRSHHILGARQIRMLDVVKCLDCFAEIQGTYEPESALSKWNTRAQLPSQWGAAVAWRVPVREGGKRTSFYTEALPFVPGIGVAVLGDPVPLYTHPADQVAKGVVVQEMEWLEQWLLLAAEPVGQECCGRAHLECCGNSEPVYRTADEIAAAMNARREELRALLAKSEWVKK